MLRAKRIIKSGYRNNVEIDFKEDAIKVQIEVNTKTMNKYLATAIVLVLLGFITFFLGLESVRTPNRLWENHPPHIFFITMQSIFFIFGGISIGKWLSTKRGM